MVSSEVQDAVDRTADRMEAVCYDVGRKLQKENQDYFNTAFKHLLNVDPSNTQEVKEFQAVLRHAEDHKANSADNRKVVRKLVITAVFGWVWGIGVVAWNYARTGPN
jgi:hypothetical protein